MTSPSDQPWIQTFTGRKFYPFHPQVEDLDIEDIAHALSLTCRFGGHVQQFYSVAEHSVRASRLVPPKDALWALMHDAPEAYLVDLPRPIKHARGMAAYRAAEFELMVTICEWLGLPVEEPESVTAADAVMLQTEKRDLLRRMQTEMGEVEWLHGAPSATPLTYELFPVRAGVAERMFLARFRELTKAAA